MTRRRELEQHRHTLGEIRDIMNSMKTLAFIETRKLGRCLDAQRAVVDHIESVAADLLGYYPEALPQGDEAASVFLLLGSERGFCGNFNETLIQRLEARLLETGSDTPRLILAGRKLCNRLEDDSRVAAFLDGASVVEETEKVLAPIVDTVTALQEAQGVLSLAVIYHDPDAGQPVIKEVLPPFEEYRDCSPQFPNPPVLNLAPTAFLGELIDHYLFATLHEVVYLSLMAENLQRVRHLEGTVQYLDDKSASLLHECNALRQEEIIEEIEVILLSAANLEKVAPRRD